MSIRFKLALLSLVILSLPYVGFEYLRETERYLQQSLEQSLLAVSGALAVALQEHGPAFARGAASATGAEPLFVHRSGYPMQVDGYLDDWEPLLNWRDQFPLEARLRTVEEPGFRLLLASHGQEVYALIEVDDATRVYQGQGAFEPEAADTVELVFKPGAEAESVFLATTGPGPVVAYRIRESWDFRRSREPVTFIAGAWQEREGGYRLEARVPARFVAQAMGVIVHDAGAGRAVRTVATGDDTRIAPNPILRTSARLQQLIDQVGLTEGRRAWVLDRGGQVLASAGSLQRESKRGAINVIYTWLLPRAADSFEDDRRAAARLRSGEVLEALAGRPATRWRSSPDERAVIVSAAHPVRLGNELVGSVVVEETTNSIQTLQREAMANLFNRTILVFFGVTAVLLVFATRLSWRIGRLSSESEAAIDVYGRVVGDVSGSRAADELGDLSRRFAAMLKRLRDYNTYLEGMAGRLSHELRTPLAVVTTSLDNLAEMPLPDGDRAFVDRAQDGAARLQGLVRRLGEATRLEQSIDVAERVEVDLIELLERCVDGYRQAYPDTVFELEPTAEALTMQAAPELLAQMFDKLVDNAVDFTPPDGRIRIRLAATAAGMKLEVDNDGPRLPATMTDALFNSMVSVRAPGERQHLGLGLYIARLIAEYHGATLQGRNRSDGTGVVFVVAFPRDGRRG